MLHQLDDRPALVEFYREEYELTKSTARKGFLLGVLGQLAAALDQPEDAIKYLGTLLKQRPDHIPSLQRFARLLAHAGRMEDVLKVTEREIKLTQGASRQAKLLHRAGEIALQLGDRERARKNFERALVAADDHSASIGALDKLLREAGDHAARLELLRTQLLYSNDRDLRISLRLEIASLLAHELARPQEALRELEALLERAPKNLSALHAAEQLSQRLGAWPSLAELLERHATAVDGPQTRALLLHRCAAIRMSKLGDPTGAIRNLVRALELWPQLGVARALLLRLYESEGYARELQNCAEAGLAAERGSDDRRAMALQLAELSPRPVVAVQYLSAVAEVRPEDYVTQLRLTRAALGADRPSRAAGAFVRAADHLESRPNADAQEVMTLRYRAARAEESAGNLDRADEIYARILDAEPGHALARSARLRLKSRKRHLSEATHDTVLADAQGKADNDIQRASYATIRAEIAERGGDLEGAMRLLEDALISQSDYLPALHAKVRVLERRGGAEATLEAVGTMQKIAEMLHVREHKVRAYCRAGRMSLRLAEGGAKNLDAWTNFAEALRLDPRSEDAFRGLLRVQTVHGDVGAPPLGDLLERRMDAAEVDGTFDRRLARAIGRLGAANGAETSAALLRRGSQILPEDSGIRTDLALCLAKLGRWDEAVGALEAAIANEFSPERSAALHYFAGDAHERANSPQAAIDHFVAAARAGYHATHSLSRAEELAARVDDMERRVETLQLLIELSPPAQRIRALQTLATLYRENLGRAEDAVDLLREVARLRPTHLEPVEKLHSLLVDLDRDDEARATVLASIAHHRAWLRTHGLVSFGSKRDEPEVLPLIQLRRLFGMIGDADGIYLCTAVLETAAPDKLSGRSCDDMLDDPFPLPTPRDGHALDLLIGDLPCASAVALLQAGARLLDAIPGDRDTAKLGGSPPMPPSSAVVTVVAALASALGIPTPLVYLDSDPARQYRVTAHQGSTPALVVGRRINGGPSTPRARDLIGRALLRLANGGDYVHVRLSPDERVGLLCGLCMAVEIETEPLLAGPLEGADLVFAADVAKAIRPDDDLIRAANRFVRTSEAALQRELAPALLLAEDRAAVIAAADPRVSLELLHDDGALLHERGTALLGYLMSDDHLSLRRALGYDRGLLLDLEDIS